MRTRKSPRNQDRLYKALGSEGQRPGTVKKPLSPEEEIERIETMLAAGPHGRRVRQMLEERLEREHARIRVREALAADGWMRRSDG
jgi:hypothetical protein